MGGDLYIPERIMETMARLSCLGGLCRGEAYEVWPSARSGLKK